jgi:hypothetical protein
VVGAGQLVGADLGGVGDRGQQGDQLAAACPVGHVVLDHPGQPGPGPAVLVEGGLEVGELLPGAGRVKWSV